MKTTVQYLDALKKRLDLPSDYAAAKVLGVTRQAVSKYRNGQSVFDEATAIRAAELLDLDPLEVISACKAESAPDARVRRVWENAWGKATGATATAAIAVVMVGLAGAPSPAQSAPLSSDNGSVLRLCQILYTGPRQT
ncbi:helix-turn-helix domain-containing protein [Burkholderia ubonensis]|uniref:helix-turn-helix domain-containing protein n=1 Tax=Burkholderia ubonensis TaxID=101571 RepID=UPI0009B57C44|nr:helix-turn-helix domain-containing protein [Burkholderia ubonensis]